MIIHHQPQSIRKAADRDAGAVGNLWRAMSEEMALQSPDGYRAGRTDLAVPAAASVASEIFVAEEFRDIVGFICLSEREMPGLLPYRRLRYALVEGFFVDPACRGRGIGAALMQEAKKWAGTRSLDYLEMTVFSDNREAVGLCRQESFSEVRQTLRYVC